MKNEADSLQKRCKLFQKVEETGNVAEACRTLGVNKSSYYNFKSLYEKYGVEGLKGNNKEDLKHLSSEKARKRKMDKIAEYVIQYPEVGCHRIRNFLLEEKVSMSANAIQNALKYRGLGSTIDRIHALEEKLYKEDTNPTEEQRELIEGKDPCMKERGLVCKAPGEVLVQCISSLHTPSTQKVLFAHYVIDRYGCLAFLIFDRSESIDVSIRLLNDSVIPYYDEMGIKIQEILLEAEEEPDAENLSRYSSFVKNYGIALRFIESTDENADGFAQRFETCFCDKLLSDPKTKLYLEEIEVLNEKCQIWLNRYNSSSYHGYRNFGNSPYDVIKEYRAGRQPI